MKALFYFKSGERGRASSMIRSESDRPIQDSITNHINKCKEEAEQQLEWIDMGGTYYSPTYRLFKERADMLRIVASMYDDMYGMFVKDDLKGEHTHYNKEELLIAEREAILNEDRDQYLQELAEDDLDYDEMISSDSNVNALSSVELLYLLNSENHNSTDFVKRTRRLKYLLGMGINELASSADVSNQVDFTFIIGLSEWFSKRFNWNVPKDSRIKYKIASFNRSLDALILSYSYNVAKTGKINCEEGREFVERLQEWLDNEGDHHIKGTPSPYAFEKNGLVSSEISMFSESYPVEASPLWSLTCPEKVYTTAISLENRVKPIIYKDSLASVKFKRLIKLYLNSLTRRISSMQYSSLLDETNSFTGRGE